MEFKKNSVIYLQIADFIYENILTLKWPVGEKISSVREFAGMMAVNPNTIMRTYTLLQDKGILYNKRGIGFFVSDDAIDKISEDKKNTFVNEDLPALFKQMELLNINFKELKALYAEYENKN